MSRGECKHYYINATLDKNGSFVTLVFFYDCSSLSLFKSLNPPNDNEMNIIYSVIIISTDSIILYKGISQELKVKVVVQGTNHDSFAVLGFELTTF